MSKLLLALALMICVVAVPVAAQDATVTPEATIAAADLPDVVRSVYDRLIEQPGLAAEVVTPMTVEQTEFPDGCLGAPSVDEMCAMMITEGYRATFETPYGTFELRTSLNGDNFRFAAPLPLPANTLPAVMYEVSGGFAGICYRMILSADGRYALSTCRGDETLISTGTLPEPDKTDLADALASYAPFKWPTVIALPAPDQFVSSFIFNGTGTNEVSEEAAAGIDGQLIALAQQLASQATPTPAASPTENPFGSCSVDPTATPCPTITFTS